jgi:hypothetical protein
MLEVWENMGDLEMKIKKSVIAFLVLINLGFTPVAHKYDPYRDICSEEIVFKDGDRNLRYQLDYADGSGNNPSQYPLKVTCYYWSYSLDNESVLDCIKIMQGCALDNPSTCKEKEKIRDACREKRLEELKIVYPKDTE